MLLGLDVGGSGTRARLAGAGWAVEAAGGSANVSDVGEARASRELARLIRGLLARRPGRVEAACAGMAGVDGPAQMERARALFERLLPGTRVLVVNDARLVLAAAGLEDGVALIAGTGSVAYGRRGEVETRAGGWGYLLGDEGSGYWVVREALRRLLDTWDRGQSVDRWKRLLAAVGCTDPREVLRAFHLRPEPGRWAAHAPLALDADPDLVEEAAAALAELATRVCRRLAVPGPVVLAGGLLLNRKDLGRAVIRALTLRLPGVRILRLTEPPVAGAVRLAGRLTAKHPQRLPSSP